METTGSGMKPTPSKEMASIDMRKSLEDTQVVAMDTKLMEEKLKFKPTSSVIRVCIFFCCFSVKEYHFEVIITLCICYLTCCICLTQSLLSTPTHFFQVNSK